MWFHRESFTQSEQEILSRYFTNTDLAVFGLVNLPEVVKGALFARYSRTHTSLRRLFLDEFYDPTWPWQPTGTASVERAERLYLKVLTEYGDDSVAQLGGAHLACEQASNLLTKVLERGRLAAYLEQSTRYIAYHKRLGERYRYRVPPEIESAGHTSEFVTVMEHLFDTYAETVAILLPHFEKLHPRRPHDSEPVWRASIRAQSYDAARGLLPAATLSNLGIYASGQAYEALLLRMRAHPLAEVREYGQLILTELRKIIPAFLTRVDLPDRGGVWSDYLAATQAALETEAKSLTVIRESRPEVILVDFDPAAETKLAAAALYPHTDLPDDQLLALVAGFSSDQRARLIQAAVGNRSNRRHKPGRGMERASYRFDILCDYGVFRDLQRHRMLTVDWQRLGTSHGHVLPPAVAEVGLANRWTEAMEAAADLHSRLAARNGPELAQYAVPFAYRIRFVMQLNPREAFHLLELRTAPGGHPDYRRVCQEMHRLIRDQAGHRQLADAMRFVDNADHDLARLESERRAEQRRLVTDAQAKPRVSNDRP